MRAVENRIELSAPPRRVWKVLTTLDDYVRWHPFITSGGKPALGASVDYALRRRDAPKLLTGEARVVLNDEPVAFGWRLGVRGFLAIDETFHIEPGERGSMLRHSMEGRGALSLLPLRFLERRWLNMVVKVDEALARHLSGTTRPPVRSDNRRKRRVAESRARHASSSRGDGQ